MQYNNLSPTFDKIFALSTASGASCPQPPAGKTLDQAQATQVIQSIQTDLNLVSLDVTDGDSVAALRDVCTARAAYSNSGLREFVFGSGPG